MSYNNPYQGGRSDTAHEYLMQYSVQSGKFTGKIHARSPRNAAKDAILQCANINILLGEAIAVEINGTTLYFTTTTLIAALQDEGHKVTAKAFGLSENDD